MDLYQQFQISPPKPFGHELDLLFAETHNELRLILVHHLNKLGFHNVRSVRDGNVALAELKLRAPDIVLAGDDLTSISGLDLLKEMREDPRMVRESFILVCKPLQKQEVMLAVESGVDDLLVKPVAPNDILPKLRSAYAAFCNPKNPERVYEFAKGRLREKDLEGARKVYEALSTQTEKAARPHVGLARVHDAKGDADTAMKHVNEAIARNPNYVHAYSFRAEMHARAGAIDKARDDFKKAASISPLNLARYQSSCEFLLGHNLVEACVELLEMAVTARLQHPFVIERLGFCYFKQKDYVKAARFLKQAVRLEPDNTSYMNSLAICFRDSKQFEEAIDVYNQILKKENENHSVMFNKALVLTYMNKNEEAIKLLKRAVKVNPEFEKAKEKLAELGATPD